MYPPGHVATAWLAADAARLGARGAGLAIFGALLPDLIDKPLLLLGLVPGTRSLGHSIAVWAVVVLLCRWARGLWPLALGGVSHLVADFLDDVFAGVFSSGTLMTGWWLWPVAASNLQLGWSTPPLPCAACWHGLEGVLVVLAVSAGVRRLSGGEAHRTEPPPPS